ncbi:hypothetical protein [Azospirillum sp. B2RO_4]|uniref:hypothetical protein n=1 Tax=Azospirillum sp. B2RO_4 TaxID=3027796 RepID=UPI003DA8100B
MIIVHPAVIEQFKALREARLALTEGERLQSQQESLQVLCLVAYGTPRGDQLFAAWEQTHRAANDNMARIEALGARREAANAAYDALPAETQLAWLRQAIPV